ncbi:17284d81-28a9-4d6e-a73b-8197293055e5 [Thermothielavioides terrestris]|uniref:17284d81-28a9-4d6e-a73b-8197293055e5 n=1 Tax=Thermothielavioides terrestris TaxID=2587410 RepID=A0A3S4BF77_9PEZI|nr:17284d81-28a9-4d6e-a73b-8197293055e5 [Thermothielavioides terrestris]
MPTVIESVSKLYGRISQLESQRLADHPMEREITLRAIRKGLSSASASGTGPKRIADIGGGPGKIAFALADEGHDVDLIDLTPELIRLAQTEQDQRRAAGNRPLLRSIAVGNALDKSALPEGAYDAVLLLGPLPDGGLVFVAFITIDAHLRDAAMRNPGKIVEFKEFYSKYLSDGRYEKFEPGQEKPTVQSFHTHPDDVRAFFAKHFADSLQLVELRSTEGILGGGLDATLAKSSDEIVQAWADLLFESYSTKEQHLGFYML